MQLKSTKAQSPGVNLKEAVLTGLPPDNGLYVPEHIQPMPESFFSSIEKLSFQEIALQVIKHLIGDDVSENILHDLVFDAFNFETPLVEIEPNINVLELFHGPTLAFKDYGARFMSRLMSHFLHEKNEKLHILVATSGDTGGAVGYGFLGVENIEVTILYPKGKVSEIQEKQLTTIGGNIKTIEVDGNFDDCQHLVKTAFLDQELNKTIKLSSANSINIARLIPQSLYYFHAYAQLKSRNRPLVFSVPSGNFGNLCGGILAFRLGLPVERFIASTNINDIIPQYLETGNFNPRPSLSTISNAMDVGNPSNFPRILAFLDNDIEKIRQIISGYKFTDPQTREAMQAVYNSDNYTLCPHSAVAYLGLKQWLKHQSNPYEGVFLSTAHPAKFLGEVEEAIQTKISLPEPLQKAFDKQKVAISMANSYSDLKDYLISEKK